MNLGLTDQMASMTDRQVVNLIYRHNLWLKHSDKESLQDELMAARAVDPARPLTAKPITAGYLPQLLVAHLLQALFLAMLLVHVA